MVRIFAPILGRKGEATARDFRFMPRRARVIVPGVTHHVTQRGSNREQVFYSGEDRLFHLGLSTSYARRYGHTNRRPPLDDEISLGGCPEEIPSPCTRRVPHFG